MGATDFDGGIVMRVFCFTLMVVILCCAALSGSRAEGNGIKGEYVEARTASVFAGACHYNGELTTTGRDAVLAWSVTSGSWDGVDLSGVRAVAVITSDANLSEIDGARRSELIVDKAASYAQATAVVNALKSRYAAMLGKVSVVRSAPVSFSREGTAYSINASGFATIDVKALPDDLCCVMPQLVWYQPLVPLAGRKVGYTTKAAYEGGSVGDPWTRSGENSAFYGSFSF
jgi:hypothetical protein